MCILVIDILVIDILVIDILVNTKEQYILSTKPTRLTVPSAKHMTLLPSSDRIDMFPNEKLETIFPYVHTGDNIPTCTYWRQYFNM